MKNFLIGIVICLLYCSCQEDHVCNYTADLDYVNGKTINDSFEASCAGGFIIRTVEGGYRLEDGMGHVPRVGVIRITNIHQLDTIK